MVNSLYCDSVSRWPHSFHSGTQTQRKVMIGTSLLDMTTIILSPIHGSTDTHSWRSYCMSKYLVNLPCLDMTSHFTQHQVWILWHKRCLPYLHSSVHSLASNLSVSSMLCNLHAKLRLSGQALGTLCWTHNNQKEMLPLYQTWQILKTDFNIFSFEMITLFCNLYWSC